MKSSRSFAALFCMLCAAALAGCSGGGGQSSTSATHVGVYVADAFSNQYTSVVVTLYKIELSQDGVKYVTVYENDGGTSIDVAQLSSTVQLLTSAELPAGTYSQTRVTIGDSITVTPTGTTTSESLPVSTSNATVANGQAIVTIPTTQTIGTSSNIVVDFHLSTFQVVSGSIVTDIQVGSPNLPTSETGIASVVGTITNLSGGKLTLSLPSGDSVPVTVSSNTAIFTPTGSAGALTDGEVAEVLGPVDPTTHTITATEVIVGVSLEGAYQSPTPTSIEGNGNSTTGGLPPPPPGNPGSTTGTSTTGTFTPPPHP